MTELKTYKVFKETIDQYLRTTSEEVGYTKATSKAQAENNIRNRLGYSRKVTIESHGENGVTTTTFKACAV